MFGFRNKTQKAKTQPLSATSVDRSESTPQQKDPKRGLFSRLRQGLSKTHALISKDIGGLLSGKIDEDLLEDLETRLLMADVGVEATEEIIDRLSSTLNRKQKADAGVLLKVLQEQMTQILEPCSHPLDISALPNEHYANIQQGLQIKPYLTPIQLVGFEAHSAALAPVSEFRACRCGVL
ncbi:MAG: signal recognition particle receptor subunit alpha [Pseudomonadota bacterium]